MNDLYFQLQELKDKYDLNYIISKESIIIFGNLKINHEYNKKTLTGDFYTYIIVNYDFPNSLPIVTDPKNIIVDFHKNPNGELCLGCNAEILSKIRYNYKNKITICDFIEKFIAPFYYSYLFYKKYGETPYGERSHGIFGIIEYYNEVFQTKHIKNTLDILEYISTQKYKGHHLCPCGSGKMIRKCHKDIMILLINNVGIKEITRDYLNIYRKIQCLKKIKSYTKLKKIKEKQKISFYLLKKENLKLRFPYSLFKCRKF